MSELVPLVHEPAMPVRKGIPGEAVFYEAWQRLMATRPSEFSDHDAMLDVVLAQYRKAPGQREATVCASIIVWLGTNCGLSFLQDCKRMANTLHEKLHACSTERAYLMTWAVENSRNIGINSGTRALEHCLSTAMAPISESVAGASRAPATDLTADDYECAECLIRWLGGADGQSFIEYCEKEIAHRHNRFPFDEREFANG